MSCTARTAPRRSIFIATSSAGRRPATSIWGRWASTGCSRPARRGGRDHDPTAQTPASFWLYYVNVDALDPAVERIKSKGGQIVNGPNEVPGGQWIVQALDPQGAVFALVAPKR